MPEKLKRIRTVLDVTKIYAGNRILARCAGAKSRWLVQCLKCGKYLIRNDTTLRDGQGMCSCRSKWATRDHRAKRHSLDNRRWMTRKEWRRICEFYGERVSPRWREDFEAFVADMGLKQPRKFLCRRTSCCMLRKESCFWGTRSQAEWPETVYLFHRSKVRRLEEIPELKGIRPERLQVLLRYAPDGPSREQTEFLIKRHRRDQIERAKRNRSRRMRVEGGPDAPESS